MAALLSVLWHLIIGLAIGTAFAAIGVAALGAVLVHEIAKEQRRQEEASDAEFKARLDRANQGQLALVWDADREGA